MTKALTNQKRFILDTYPFRRLSIVRGNRCYLFDESGNKYLDFMTNYGVNVFGYGSDVLNTALINQFKRLANIHGSFANNVRSEAAHRLVKKCGGRLAKVYFANSGSEAVEAALKFAILATGKSKVISMKKAYHGKTLAALSVTDSKKYKKDLEKLLWDIEFVEFGDFSQLEGVVGENTAAVIIEPIQGESGVIVPSKRYLQGVEKLCREGNVLLIVDEIQTGLGRTGSFLRSHTEGIEPDIVCLGKGLAGGIPAGATLVTEDVAQKIPKLIQTSTFGGNPLAAVGILTTLDLLDEKLEKNIETLGKYFMYKLKSIKSDLIVDVRGVGLMIGVQVKSDRTRILKRLQDRGVLTAPAGEDVIRFLPPYIVTRRQIDNAVQVLKEVLG